MEYDNLNRLIHEYDFGYDSQGNITEIYRNHYIWGPNSLTAYSYDYYEYDRTTEYYKGVGEFDAQGRMIAENISSSPDSLTWVEEERQTFSYHAHDTSDFSDFVEWVSDSYLNWEDIGEIMGFGYGAIMISETIAYEWGGREWAPYYKEEYLWNNDNDRLMEKNTQEMINAVWNPSGKYVFAYDPNGNPTELLSSYWEDNAWVVSTKYVPTWEYAVANEDPTVPTPEALRVQVWPQPFNSKVNIVCDTGKAGSVQMDIYNLKGQKLLSLTGDSGAPIIWDGRDDSGRMCGNGCYLIRASQDGKNGLAKAVLMK